LSYSPVLPTSSRGASYAYDNEDNTCSSQDG